MIKLKDILNEGYAWEREAGKPLPTLADTTAAHAAKMAEQSAMQPISNPIDEKWDDENWSDPMIDGDENPDRDDSQRDEVFDIIMTYTKDPDVAEEAYAAWESGAEMSPELQANVTRDPRWKYVRSPQRESARPDYLDLDQDGNEVEPMKKAAQDRDAMQESLQQRITNNLRGHEYILAETFKRK